MRQTIAALPINLFMKLVWYWQSWQCPSGASLRFAACHTTCSSYGIRHGSSCVLHATSFISSFVPLHYTTFAARHLLQGMAHYPAHKAKHKWCTYLFASHPTILTGFHSAPLRPTFISVAFSPPAANNFARLAYHRLRSGAALTQRPLLMHWPAHKAWKCMSRSAPSLCVHRSWRHFTVRPSQWCSQPLPFVPLSSGFWRLATLLCYSRCYSQRRLTLLFAAGAFTLSATAHSISISCE